MSKPRVLSGVQPTGNLHLGNYLGAIRNWVGLQDSHECFFMMADLHAITVPQDPAKLIANTRETAAAFIAAGIDPDKSVLFPQSAVSMHAELAWILNCHTPLGWLNRMTQFKEKARIDDSDRGINKQINDIAESVWEYFQDSEASQDVKASHIRYSLDNIKKCVKSKDREVISKTTILNEAKLGLYGYPVLMAADILGYKATHVPVGEDQKQHLELARDIAGAFNRAYGEEFFPLPEPLIMPTAARIMSLRDGTKKMSKSDESDYSRITLTDDADTIAKKIKKATTDSEPTITLDPEKRPEIANLLTIYAALTDSTPQKAAAHFTGAQTGAFKTAVADVAVEKLAPITARMRELTKDTPQLDRILKRGAEAANDVAQPILREVKQRVGFLQFA